MTEEEQIAHLADVPVVVRAEIERGTVRFRDLLNLKAGGVFRTSRPVTDRVTLIVGDCRIGAGEILTASGRASLRILEISPRT
jgi:flagellar motor switch/type III secretory pathway protein FliN